MSNFTTFEGLNPTSEFEPLPRPSYASQLLDVRLVDSFGPYDPGETLNDIPDATAIDYGNELYDRGYRIIRKVGLFDEQGNRSILQIATADMDGTTKDIKKDLLDGAKLGPILKINGEGSEPSCDIGLALWYSPEQLVDKGLLEKVNKPQILHNPNKISETASFYGLTGFTGNLKTEKDTSNQMASLYNQAVNVEMLRTKGELGYFFSVLYEAAIAAEPNLADVMVRATGSQYESILAKTGGFATHAGETESGRYEITINTDDGIEHYERLLSERRGSAEASIEELGFGSITLDSKLLAGFIFLHELGHIADFAANYPELKDKNTQREAEMGSLPIPGYNPAGLLLMLRTPDGNAWFEKAKSLLYERFGVRSIEELMFLQDQRYRETPMEHAADTFAARILRPFA